MTIDYPTIDAARAQAKRLRAASGESGNAISHSQSLELLARQYGARDWNSFVAASAATCQPNAKRPPGIGEAVTGAYLGKPFTAKVHSIKSMGDDGGFRISLALDAPVNVSAFDSFDVLRRRIQGTLDANGVSPQRISDGTPQLVVNL